MVQDIAPGSDSLGWTTSQSWFTPVDNQLYFTAHGAGGLELWRSDGTSTGTYRVKDINPKGSALDSTPRYLTNVNSTLYFTANDGTNSGLWKTDGTEAGTVKVLDLVLGGATPYQASDLVNLNGTLYFTASNKAQGYELWRTDGTAAGTTLVKDINTQPSGTVGRNANGLPHGYVNLNGTLYFIANDGVNGKSLWKSDGTDAGTVIVKDTNPQDVNNSGPQQLVLVGNSIFFLSDSFGLGRELWVSDGSTAGTHQVRDFSPGSYSSVIPYYTNVNGTLFFSFNSMSIGSSIWKTDGTDAGTVLVKDIATTTTPPPPEMLAAVGNKLFFDARDDSHGYELWVSDGTTAGTNMVLDINNNTDGSFIRGFTVVNDIAFFNAYSTGTGSELWRTNGTAAGTMIVKDINPGTKGNTQPQELTNVNGTLYFTATGPSNKRNLWKSDGTDAGTVEVTDFDGLTVQARNLFNLNGILYFVGYDSLRDYELWRTDGTPIGTRVVKDIFPGAKTSNPESFTNVSGTLYFTTRQTGTVFTQGPQLWKSDGTLAGTTLVHQFDLEYSLPQELVNVNGTLFFSAGDDTNGYEVWKSDGTNNGTVIVKDIRPNTIGRKRPTNLINAGGVLTFREDDNVNGMALWKTDGTAAGTQLLKPGVGGGTIGFNLQTVYANHALYFINGSDGAIWKTDGSVAGTVKAVDNTTPNLGSPLNLIAETNNLLYFFASDIRGSGVQLWRTELTSGITAKVDLPMDRFLSTGYATLLGNEMIFSGGREPEGEELWKVSTAYVVQSVDIGGDGTITISDNTNRNDIYTINRTGANVVITDDSLDPDKNFALNGVAGATLSTNKRSVSIPLATIQATGKPLLIKTGDGNDTINFDAKNLFANSPVPANGLNLDLGSGSDTFQLVNTVTNNIWTINNSQSGNVKVGSLGTVTFNGSETIQGGKGSDVFKLINTNANLISKIDGGSGANDRIEVSRNMNVTLTDVSLNIQSLTSTDPLQNYALANIEQAFLTGGAGNNFFDAHTFNGSTTLLGGDGSDVLWGGAGKDTINGGNGDDSISGGDGSDILAGGAGRDILIGGKGSDQLNLATSKGSDAGDDIQIGGDYNLEFDKAAVDALLASWVAPRAYVNHISLLAVTGVGSTKQYKLNASSVVDDTAIDILYGGGGTDWFLATTTGLFQDQQDKTGNEQVVVL